MDNYYGLTAGDVSVAKQNCSNYEYDLCAEHQTNILMPSFTRSISDMTDDAVFSKSLTQAGKNSRGSKPAESSWSSAIIK